MEIEAPTLHVAFAFSLALWLGGAAQGRGGPEETCFHWRCFLLFAAVVPTSLPILSISIALLLLFTTFRFYKHFDSIAVLLLDS